ncbi:MAG: pyridoxal phosphate-dependent aminotransferase [Tissierellaceae bacterium]|nr:pyridoxal phosphate-dependent aminotransferase [Tissierellaceae bacterium]
MLSKKISDKLGNSSWIRAMFEQGIKLRKIYGDDKVYDFSLGNPDPQPPIETKEALRKLVIDDSPELHKYMSNAGFLDVREKVAFHINKETGLDLTAENIIMTVGAAGAINVILKAILEQDDEVIALSPYFVDYGSYVDNHGGKLVLSPCTKPDFQPDLLDLEKRITPKTKAIIINSPNNPTGVIYKEEVLKNMAKLLEDKEKELGTEILVISDEPYVKLVYDGVKVPSILNIFKNSAIVYSYSKSLAIPGERIGYIAVNPAIKDASRLVAGLVFANRVLGFVNAPGLFQKLIAESLDHTVDPKIYQERRDKLFDILTSLGFECIKPEGTFYLFPKALIEDDIAFVKHALKYNLLFVPGSGFGCPGYFRISYCVDMKTIENSIPAFEALANDFKNMET